jgi:hypothetical protein
MKAERDMSEKERDAVIEAAKVIVDADGQELQCCVPVMIDEAAYDNLKAAVRNLTRSEGVRPEEVEPVTRFKFRNPDRPSSIYRTVKTDTGKYGFMYSDDWVIRCFLIHDRIIPLEDTQP